VTDDAPVQSAAGGAGPGGEWQVRGRGAAGALAETWAGLAAATADLDDAAWSLPTACPGWDVKDQVSHVIGIERSLLGDDPPVWDGPMGDHVKNEFGAALEPWVAVRRPRSGAEVRAELVEVTAERLARLHALGEEEWARVGYSPAGDVPYAVFMEVRVFDCWVHEQDIRDGIGRAGHDTGPAAEQSLDEIARAAGYLVGKKAGAPAGSGVRIALTGPIERHIDVEVGERAKVVDALAGEPTATVTLSSTALARLACGRIEPAQVFGGALGGVQLAGDEELGRRVVENLAFTI